MFTRTNANLRLIVNNLQNHEWIRRAEVAPAEIDKWVCRTMGLTPTTPTRIVPNSSWVCSLFLISERISGTSRFHRTYSTFFDTDWYLYDILNWNVPYFCRRQQRFYTSRSFLIKTYWMITKKKKKKHNKIIIEKFLKIWNIVKLNSVVSERNWLPLPDVNRFMLINYSAKQQECRRFNWNLITRKMFLRYYDECYQISSNAITVLSFIYFVKLLDLFFNEFSSPKVTKWNREICAFDWWTEKFITIFTLL